MNPSVTVFIRLLSETNMKISLSGLYRADRKSTFPGKEKVLFMFFNRVCPAF